MYDVTPIATATGNLEQAMAGDLAQGSAGSGDLTVDLAALYTYYNELMQLDAELAAQLRQLTPDAGSGLSGGYCGAPDGVRLAFEATSEARTGRSSLFSSVKAVQTQLRAHLEALRMNYVSYTAQESANAHGLTNAATAWADKPLGW